MTPFEKAQAVRNAEEALESYYKHKNPDDMIYIFYNYNEIEETSLSFHDIQFLVDEFKKGN